jgi:hypothetical protein
MLVSRNSIRLSKQVHVLLRHTLSYCFGRWCKLSFTRNTIRPLNTFRKQNCILRQWTQLHQVKCLLLSFELNVPFYGRRKTTASGARSRRSATGTSGTTCPSPSTSSQEPSSSQRMVRKKTMTSSRCPSSSLPNPTTTRRLDKVTIWFSAIFVFRDFSLAFHILN